MSGSYGAEGLRAAIATRDWREVGAIMAFTFLAAIPFAIGLVAGTRAANAVLPEPGKRR